MREICTSGATRGRGEPAVDSFLPTLLNSLNSLISVSNFFFFFSVSSQSQLTDFPGVLVACEVL